MKLTFFIPLVYFLLSPILADQALETEVLEVSDLLRCPVCQGLSVKDSDTAIAVNMKNKIREMLLAGKSHNEIMQFFEERYGEWILRAPRKKGLNLILWLLPMIFVSIGGGICIFCFTRWRKKRISEPQNIQALTKREEALLNEKMNRFQ